MYHERKYFFSTLIITSLLSGCATGDLGTTEGSPNDVNASTSESSFFDTDFFDDPMTSAIGGALATAAIGAGLGALVGGGSTESMLMGAQSGLEASQNVIAASNAARTQTTASTDIESNPFPSPYGSDPYGLNSDPSSYGSGAFSAAAGSGDTASLPDGFSESASCGFDDVEGQRGAYDTAYAERSAGGDTNNLQQFDEMLIAARAEADNDALLQAASGSPTELMDLFNQQQRAFIPSYSAARQAAKALGSEGRRCSAVDGSASGMSRCTELSLYMAMVSVAATCHEVARIHSTDIASGI